MLSIEFSEENWERPITELMLKGKTSLERLIEGTGNQAALPSISKACIELRVATGGFHRFVFAFAERPDFWTSWQIRSLMIQHSIFSLVNCPLFWPRFMTTIQAPLEPEPLRR